MGSPGRVVSGLTFDDERDCWVETDAPRHRPSYRRGGATRAWTDEDHLLMVLAALRTKQVPGLAGRIRVAGRFTAAQYSCGRSVALDALGMPHGYGSTGGRCRELLKVLGPVEAERRAWALLARLEPGRFTDQREDGTEVLCG